MNRTSRRQDGVALVMGLIILLILTIVGITAIKGSTQQERMASNFQLQAQSFQSAESAIHLTLSQVNNQGGANLTLSGGITRNTDILSAVLLAAPNPFYSATTALPPTDPDGAGNAVMQLVSSAVAADGTGFNSRANVYATNPTSIPPMTGSSFGKFTAYSFEINAVATQPTTLATANNIQGVWYIAPKAGP